MEFGIEIEQNHLSPDFIIGYFPKYSSIIVCQDAFLTSILEFKILLELIFVDNVYTKYCETSEAIRYRLNLRLFIGKGMIMVGNILCALVTTKSVVIVTLWRYFLFIQDGNVVILLNLATLKANWLNWLVDQIPRVIALAIEASRQDFVWNGHTNIDKLKNKMIRIEFFYKYWYFLNY